jgi:hypothetical protein
MTTTDQAGLLGKGTPTWEVPIDFDGTLAPDAPTRHRDALANWRYLLARIHGEAGGASARIASGFLTIRVRTNPSSEYPRGQQCHNVPQVRDVNRVAGAG